MCVTHLKCRPGSATAPNGTSTSMSNSYTLIHWLIHQASASSRGCPPACLTTLPMASPSFLHTASSIHPNTCTAKARCSCVGTFHVQGIHDNAPSCRGPQYIPQPSIGLELPAPCIACLLPFGVCGRCHLSQLQLPIQLQSEVNNCHTNTNRTKIDPPS